jgi:hypothetical protein
MTPVVLSPEAAAYVRQRGGALTLRRSPRHGCCGGTVGVPVAEAVAPADTRGFVQRALDAPGGPVRLFVASDLDAPAAGPVRVGLDRVLGLAALYVEGADARL